MQHLPKSLRRTSLCLGAALATLYLAGCGHVQYTAGPSGPQPDTYVELEPNDSPAFADFVSIVDPATYLLVDGHVQAVGLDIVDHIEFEASEPVEIEFFLEAFGPYGDVDVSIYDPIDQVILATYASDGPYESGTIVVHDPGRPFQFVIEAFMEDSPWTLELVGHSHVCNCLGLGSTEGGSSAANPQSLAPAGSGDAGEDGDRDGPRPIEILVGP